VVHPVLLQNVASKEVIPIWPVWVPLVMTATGRNTYMTPLGPATLRRAADGFGRIRRRLAMVVPI